ncbi:MAG TPA: ferrous iron transporter B, partial [Maribacter sp.]|nr:ferrous iron transporter B [Maribacter sp.]
LWFLGSNGFSDEFKNAETIVTNRVNEEGFSSSSEIYFETHQDGLDINDSDISNQQKELEERALAQEIAGYKLEHSYMGYMGKAIEPVVRPLGYDWKIGIAVLTSFAAREVFVGTLATIYSVGNDEEETIKNRMAAEINPRTKKPLFNLASGISLLLFYAFAMQCMSTLAVVKRETNSWKWPAGQLVFMSLFAYIVAFIAYQLLK